MIVARLSSSEKGAASIGLHPQHLKNSERKS